MAGFDDKPVGRIAEGRIEERRGRTFDGEIAADLHVRQEVRGEKPDAGGISRLCRPYGRFVDLNVLAVLEELREGLGGVGLSIPPINPDQHNKNAARRRRQMPREEQL